MIVITMFLFSSFKAYSQNNSNRGSLMSLGNPNNLFYVGGRLSEKTNPPLSLEMKNTYRLAESSLNTSREPWLLMKNPDREGIDLVFVRKPNVKIRVFQSLINRGDYLVLCSRSVVEPCNCKNEASLYFYLPGENKLKLVERAFSLSIKRNLISDLNKYTESNLSVDDFENVCSVLNALGGSQ